MWLPITKAKSSRAENEKARKSPGLFHIYMVLTERLFGRFGNNFTLIDPEQIMPFQRSPVMRMDVNFLDRLPISLVT